LLKPLAFFIIIKKGDYAVHVREKKDVAIVDLEGEIRLTENLAPSLHKTITELLVSKKVKILLNFEKVDFIDSYGIGDLVAAYVAVQGKSGKLKIAGLSPKIWTIFHYSGLTRILEIFDSEEKALKSFA
jgi:anti-sigma B factor antagonist